MNNTTHTPGPWYPHYAKADHCLSSSVWGKEPGNQVAVIGGKSLEAMNANARLIAAAPAMYALLKRAAISLQEYCAEINGDMNDSLACEIEATIAQAEGVSHE